ncbi:hypothetical protein GFL09_13645 [Pseudomonas stutzeri]|uniref:hypothetical protein n=1 Tax=Stutzerimonas stutzeri TaxID=316 RepID=UPI00190CD49B|nr:hypothetical protein [Stutzerimonas stutzeri]MBK3868717.1 hypothetical protein [Stutzerimonas stutzeri]
MTALKALIVGVAFLSSMLAYGGDGYDRSAKFNEEFRADQKRIHGNEQTAKTAGELKVKPTSQGRVNNDTKKEAKAKAD